MKKCLYLFALALFALQGCEKLEPPTPNEVAFSVSSNKQVKFAPGNLQYQASTKTWRFAEHQYDIIGLENEKISDSYDGWIDLFGWGTGEKPTNTSGVEPNDTLDVDWGVNKIGSDSAFTWRTLTDDEWVYIFYGRENAPILFGLGTVNGVHGAIILPDKWESFKGKPAFTPSSSHGLANKEGVYYYNDEGGNFSLNTYTVSQWKKMESFGAIFLPASGMRRGTGLHDVGDYGYYWSSTAYNEHVAYRLIFRDGSLGPRNLDSRSCGHSVRLARDL